MFLACAHRYARRPEHLAVDAVALLEHLEDLALGAGLGQHRLVQVRVELLAGRREALDARVGERARELLVDEPDTLDELVLSPFHRDERALQVVDDRKEVRGERSPPTSLRLRGLTRDTLAVVLEVRLGPPSQREVLVPLVLEPGHELTQLALELLLYFSPGMGGGVTARDGRRRGGWRGASRSRPVRRLGAGRLVVLLSGALVNTFILHLLVPLVHDLGVDYFLIR